MKLRIIMMTGIGETVMTGIAGSEGITAGKRERTWLRRNSTETVDIRTVIDTNWHAATKKHFGLSTTATQLILSGNYDRCLIWNSAETCVDKVKTGWRAEDSGDDEWPNGRQA